MNDCISLGIIGCSPGNGHPYSWSAIFNGYNIEEMRSCPFPVIPAYLSRQQFPNDCIKNAQVTHIWTQNMGVSMHIAKAARINNIVSRYEDMIGQVDAILLARDDAENHFSIAKPFLDAGVPVYIDKPIAINLIDLEKILQLQQYPGQLFSCSALRFSKDLIVPDADLQALGDISYVEATTPKNWATYAVHLIDPVLHLLKLNGESAITKSCSFNQIQLLFASWDNITIKFSSLGDTPSPINIKLFGANQAKTLIFNDTFQAFKGALQSFLEGVRQHRQMISHGELRGCVRLIEQGMPIHE